MYKLINIFLLYLPKLVYSIGTHFVRVLHSMHISSEGLLLLMLAITYFCLSNFISFIPKDVFVKMKLHNQSRINKWNRAQFEMYHGPNSRS